MIPSGSGGGSDIVGRAESESELEIVGKPKENKKHGKTKFFILFYFLFFLFIMFFKHGKYKV